MIKISFVIFISAVASNIVGQHAALAKESQTAFSGAKDVSAGELEQDSNVWIHPLFDQELSLYEESSFEESYDIPGAGKDGGNLRKPYLGNGEGSYSGKSSKAERNQFKNRDADEDSDGEGSCSANGSFCTWDGGCCSLNCVDFFHPFGTCKCMPAYSRCPGWVYCCSGKCFSIGNYPNTKWYCAS